MPHMHDIGVGQAQIALPKSFARAKDGTLVCAIRALYPRAFESA